VARVGPVLVLQVSYLDGADGLLVFCARLVWAQGVECSQSAC
jgi:hypothetical protein